MKFALVDGMQQEAIKGLHGICRNCERPMVAKCGDKNIHHWSHKGRLECDPWWENETEWHRHWKNHFPVEWQEISHKAEDGERHIADVKTAQGWVVEFQHSPIKPEELLARNTFYRKITWIVDGKRRQRDHQQFLKALEDGKQFSASPLVVSVCTDDCKLLAEWGGINKPVFFDFGEADFIWLLHPRLSDGRSYVVAYSRRHFIDLHRGEEPHEQQFIKSLNDFDKFIHEYLSYLATQFRPKVICSPHIPRKYYSTRRFRGRL